MMLWQILILSFLISGFQLNGFNFNHFFNFVLQSFYIFMFFRWETGYFNTLDFIMDKTGWMLVWGCLVWIPSLYTFSSFFLVKNAHNLGHILEIGILILGILAIWFHSEADRQKELFKNAKGKSVKVCIY
jgi:7-dehydrocholesterol reductase